MTTGSNGVYLQNNNNSPNFGGTPFTRPEFNNCSFIGPLHCDPVLPINTKFDHGIMVDKNAGMDMWNSVITGYNKYGFYIEGATSAARTANDELNFSYNSMTNNGSGDYGKPSTYTWSGNGCGTSMADWMSGSQTCSETGNQFSPFVLGYDASFCGVYCASGFIPYFVLNPMTSRLDDPSSSSLYDFRGAVQADSLFTWIEACPQNQVYCTSEMEKEANEKKSSLIIVPNPAQSQATLVFEAKTLGLAKVLILDKVTGRVLFQKNIPIRNMGEQKITISVKELREGIYPIRVQLKDAVINGMISIQ